MDSIKLHLLINELPVVGILIGLIILVAGLILNNRSVKRTSLFIFILSALVTIPSYLSGLKAQEGLIRTEGIDQGFVAEHRSVAYAFIRMIAITGVLSVITLILDWTNRSKASVIFYIITLASGVFMFFMTQSVGSSGREIRHTEVRSTDTLKFNK